jgi:hypothetical protein
VASSKEEFAEIIKKLRALKTSGDHAECSCPNARCELHGDCYNCIRAYRHFGHHVPRCLQFVLDRKMACIIRAVENEMGPRPISPDEYYDYAESILPRE